MESVSEPLDALELGRALDGHGVGCVVIGGVAMQVHGHVRTTRNLDTIVAWTPENMGALAGALAELDARLLSRRRFLLVEGERAEVRVRVEISARPTRSGDHFHEAHPEHPVRLPPVAPDWPVSPTHGAWMAAGQPIVHLCLLRVATFLQFLPAVAPPPKQPSR